MFKLVINTTKCDLCLSFHKMCCKVVWKFCEIWKILWELLSRWAKFWEILSHSVMVGWLCCGLTSQSTIFQSCRDGAIASWVINQYFRGVKCLAQGHNTAAVGFEPRTSRSGVRHSTTEPPRSHLTVWDMECIPTSISDLLAFAYFKMRCVHCSLIVMCWSIYLVGR